MRGAAIGLAAVSGLAVAGYLYQPMRYDLFPRAVPADSPPLDPESAVLFSPHATVALVTAHPDDAEFYMGGTLARLKDAGARVWLIVATEGDKALWPWEDPARNRRVRPAEQRASAGLWGARGVVFLTGYNDARVSPSAALERDIRAELERIRPGYVFTFDGEYPPQLSHRDHRAVGIAATRAVREAAAETARTGHAGRWLIHFSTRAPNWAVDVTGEWARKMEMLRLHASQFHGRRLALITDMQARMGHDAGRMAHAAYGEAFRCERIEASPPTRTR